MDWETVASIFAAVVLLAAFVKASVYLWERARSRRNAVVAWWDERKRVRRALATLTAASGWPNGSKSLPDSLTTMYDLATTNQKIITRFIEDHRARHIDLDARLENLDEPSGTPNGF